MRDPRCVAIVPPGPAGGHDCTVRDRSCDNRRVRPDDDNETVLYEVNLDADAAIEGPFDTWLRDHIADMLQFDGFLSAEILNDAESPPDRIRRIVQYRLRDQAALDRYLRVDAPEMRTRGVALFGDRFSAGRRQLAHREEFIRGAVSTENCLNCGEVLTGQHCSHCGQRAKVRVLSLGSLLRDLFGDLIDYDSRVWRTLRPLAFKPGWLTVEYLRGRRTHYSPPFRMYLILSVAFFLAASIGTDPEAIDFRVGDGGANLQIGPGDEAAGSADATGGEKDGKTTGAGARSAVEAPAPAASKTGTDKAADAGAPAAGTKAPVLDPQRRKLIDQIVKRLPADEQANARADLERELGELTPEQAAPLQRFVDDPCGKDGLKLEAGPGLKKYEPRLRDACRKIVADSKSFGRAVYENIPKMMFIFLPLIAALMFVLYAGSGRYYVEHLLFFVHYHAFFFLGGLAIVIADRLAAWLPGLSAVFKGLEAVLMTALVLYVPYYLYRAMRRVYGQGRAVTLVKYSLLCVGYLFFMTLTAVGLLFYTALTL
jgi:hypothetical protein